MSQPDGTQLHQFIVAHFNLDELKTLCFNLGVEFDDLGGEGREGKARELVKWTQNRSRLDYLIAQLSLARPEAYRKRFHESPIIPVAPPRLRRNPRQVFISHAHQDAGFAQRVARDLQARGYPIWIAPGSIRIGEDWPDAIDRGLDESGVMVVALTPDAMTSYWVRKETSAARLLEGKGLARLVLLDVAECDLPSSWLTYQFANFRDGYAAGLNQLLQALGGKPTPPGHRLLAADRLLHEKTGIELIRIPAGPFLYGSADTDKMARDNEKPQRTIHLPEYWIGRAPVTNAQYKRFLDANPNYRLPFRTEDWAKPYNWDEKRRAYPADKADHPVVLVSWHDAQAFCDWAGLALPTEAQWEKAARGTDGRVWPWGNEPPTDKHCNFNMNVRDTTPVGNYSPTGDSPFGCVDMAGNVWEWTASWYTEGLTRALRGGSWYYSDQLSRAASRLSGDPDYRNYLVGFRVAELLSDPGF